KIFLVDFWASWCVPCRKEIPNLKNIYAANSKKGLEIISVSIDKNEAAWKKALEKEKLPWPNGIDKSGVDDLYHVQAIPAIFIVDAVSGKVIGENLRGEELAAKVTDLLK
ncbi:MAG: TlpA family protein disulfide reductase, partial [Prevotella sp.]|nr:TlpA family protein disulfide reductase [Prevotella sp.]